jgi:hypothetical protein
MYMLMKVWMALKFDDFIAKIVALAIEYASV